MSREGLLNQIREEFPEQVRESSFYAEMEPAVREEYLYELCEGDESLENLFEEMIEYFYRYTRDVCEQESLIKKNIPENIEEIRSRDKDRTILHNAMIDSVKIFSRNLGVKGKDNSWIDGIDKGGRAGYAKLALLTTFLDILKPNPNEQ